MTTVIPRIEFAQLTPGLADALRPRVERLGYLGEFFKCAAHQPHVLQSFMQFTDDLKAALPDNLTEVVALTVASVMRNAYERHQHERLSRKLGFAERWIRGLIELQADALQDDERLVQRLVIAVIRHAGHDVTAEVEAVACALGPAATMAVLFLIGRYVTHSMIVNALDLAPPVPSVFDEPSG